MGWKPILEDHALFKASRVSAPGSLMLLGEHAVLHGFGALSMAIDKRIRVTVKPDTTNTKNITIHSSLGNYQGSLDTLVIQKPLQFILASILHLQKDIPVGFLLIVESEFSEEVGLGSSAAVTVATVAALAKAFDFEVDIFKASKQIVQTVQGGVGSGADIAASMTGGIVHYRNGIQKIEVSIPILVVYTGSKKPTTEVVAMVEHQRKKYPSIYQGIFKTLDSCVERACSFLQTKNWHALGEIMNLAQGIMMTMGLSTPSIQNILEALRHEPHIYGAKISGSGLGDCVIALGHLEANSSISPLDCQLSSVGLYYE